MTVLPMFPLGVSLLPGMVLPLHLFEPRYLELYRDVVDDDRRFGVVLIERGPDTRDDNPMSSVGCVARIMGSGIHDDGTISLVTIGEHLIRVDRWLHSDPYPQAEVSPIEEPTPGKVATETIDEARRGIVKLVALASELDPSFDPAMPDLSPDPMEAGYQIAQIAGFQAFDNQRIIEAPGPDARAEMILGLVNDQIELIELQLGMP